MQNTIWKLAWRHDVSTLMRWWEKTAVMLVSAAGDDVRAFNPLV